MTTPRTPAELRTALEALHPIVEGPAVAYFDDHNGVRVYYQTAAIGKIGPDDAETKADVCAAIWQELSDAITKYKRRFPGEKLYWRKVPEGRYFEADKMLKVRLRIGGPGFELVAAGEYATERGFEPRLIA